jgi:hypothetical protein
MLWVMVIVWLAQGQPYYPSMGTHQRVAYISDIGAGVLKPLFVTGCCLTAVFFFASLLSMRRNHALIRRLERTLDALSLVAGLVGAVCLVLLAAFDTHRHPSLHRLFLLLFMMGVVFSALFTTVEYRRLGKTFTQHTVLGWSYRFKQGIVAVEVALSVAFGVTMYRKLHDTAAILEWCEFFSPPPPAEGVLARLLTDSAAVIAFAFTFYVLSFFFDLRPAARTKEEVRYEMREARRAADDVSDDGLAPTPMV